MLLSGVSLPSFGFNAMRNALGRSAFRQALDKSSAKTVCIWSFIRYPSSRQLVTSVQRSLSALQSRVDDLAKFTNTMSVTAIVSSRLTFLRLS